MNLKGKFTDELDGHADYESVRKAIASVNDVFTCFLKKGAEEEECLNFFFDDGEKMIPNQNFSEIMDFWEVIKPYVWKQSGKYIQDFWIIRVIKEIETVWQVVMYNKILDQETERHLYTLRKLSDSIEDMTKKEAALQIDENDNIEVIYPLRYFDEQCYHPYRDFILQNIYMLLKGKGKLLIVTNQDKYFMYEMNNFEWKSERISNKEAYKLCIEGDNDSAIKKGLIPGFVYDELR